MTVQKIGYITGDGIGIEITPIMQSVVNAAIKKAYNNNKKIEWIEMLAGLKAYELTNEYLPKKTLQQIKDFRFNIKGPLLTPSGGGFRSINVTLRQELDLFICLRPVKWFKGIKAPVINPQDLDIVIFRENSEDIYAGIEWQSNSPEVKKLLKFLTTEMNVNKIRFTENLALGIKPISKEGSERVMREAINYAIKNKRKIITIIHKGNIMKWTEGGFCNWAYQLAEKEFNAKIDPSNNKYKIIETDHGNILINDVISDAMFQKLILNPKDCDVIVSTNLNGDYLSDAAAAQVGGLGIAPGANIGKDCFIFEATHGCAPDIVGKNIANPTSMILSAQMMLNYLEWNDAANIIIDSYTKLIVDYVTADLKNSNSKVLSNKEFGLKWIDYINNS